jgi:hypothetical protein
VVQLLDYYVALVQYIDVVQYLAWAETGGAM